VVFVPSVFDDKTVQI